MENMNSDGARAFLGQRPVHLVGIEDEIQKLGRTSISTAVPHTGRPDIQT